MTFPSDLPDDIDALKAIIMASQAKMSEQSGIIERKEDRILRLEKLLADFKRALYGAEDEAIDPPKTSGAAKSAKGRGVLPKHLPRIEEVIAPDVTCGCGAERHIIGEDVSERLDIVPAQFRVLVIRRPKYACRSCEAGIVQTPAKPRLIEGGMPTEATIASVIVSKYADHLPLYRQSQIYARQGVDIDRST